MLLMPAASLPPDYHAMPLMMLFYLILMTVIEI